ncbi:putative ATP synthase subunit f, mitochondrial [Aphis craccivora]|uniref:Putative ATP synthase subunit f, mitochondrial n=1 Tax=Aphis craccivora TaxID=307492 RepID=A0A6G0YZ89_APHCR|nr:putative ATP synthase subunit f, mitochondrial [Aphis craccivora]
MFRVRSFEKLKIQIIPNNKKDTIDIHIHSIQTIYSYIKTAVKHLQDRPAGSYKINIIDDYPAEFNLKIH